MLDTVWRALKEDFDVEGFLHKYGLFEEATVFLKDRNHRGNINKKSGFNILISESLDSKTNCLEINEFIKNHESAFQKLHELGISSTFDIGCSPDEHFTKSITIEPSLLMLIAKYNISLEFSAYRPSNDENET